MGTPSDLDRTRLDLADIRKEVHNVPLKFEHRTPLTFEHLFTTQKSSSHFLLNR